MNRIESIFGELKASGRKGLMPFVCGGHPSLGATERVIPALERAGASIIEVGIPFSDPIADGPVIAAAMHEALVAGVTPRAVLGAVAKARASATKVGLVAMVSASIVWRAGPERFVHEAKAAGFDGFIFPDVPAEEAEDFAAPARKAGMTVSLLVAPTTPAERVKLIVERCTGFVYLLARVGITGESGGCVSGGTVAGAPLRERVGLVRSMTSLPIACGFGIATPEHVRVVVKDAGAEAVIVGSALVKRMGRTSNERRDPVDEAEGFVRAMKVGLA